jgi:hypothetical protein
VINQKNTPADNGLALDPKVEKLIFDMVSLNAEQINHLWAMLEVNTILLFYIK